MKKADLHTHTRLCRHAAGEPEEYVRTLASRGFSFFGLSDHSPFPERYDTLYRMAPAEYPLYKEFASRARQEAEKLGMEFLFGIETDYVVRQPEASFRTPEKDDFDYVIGSVHYVDDFAFDDPDLMEEWKKPGRPEEVWKVYLQHLTAYVEGGTFDIIAHADLPKKFGYRPVEDADFRNAYHRIFEAAAAKGMALELNAAGLHCPVSEIYPSLTILKIAKEHGLLLTYGSDAHKPDQPGRDFDAAKDLALAAGFRGFSAFRKRKSFFLPFD